MKLLIIASLILCLPLLALAQQSRKAFAYDYTIDDLSNGLRVVSVPTDYPNLVALYIVVQTGSRNEPEKGKSGYAHLFEHLMFRGSEHYPGKERNGLDTSNVLPALLEVPMREDYRLPVNGHEYLILHGDRFDPTMNYPVVQEAAFLAYQFTTKLNKKLAKWLKRKSKKWGGILELVRSQSISFARKEGLHGVITGHTHFAEDVLIDDIHYVNSGSWTESPCAYITADNGELKLHHVSD